MSNDLNSFEKTIMMLKVFQKYKVVIFMIMAVTLSEKNSDIRRDKPQMVNL